MRISSSERSHDLFEILVQEQGPSECCNLKTIKLNC